MENYLLLKDF